MRTRGWKMQKKNVTRPMSRFEERFRAARFRQEREFIEAIVSGIVVFLFIIIGGVLSG